MVNQGLMGCDRPFAPWSSRQSRSYGCWFPHLRSYIQPPHSVITTEFVGADPRVRPCHPNLPSYKISPPKSLASAVRPAGRSYTSLSSHHPIPLCRQSACTTHSTSYHNHPNRRGTACRAQNPHLRMACTTYHHTSNINPPSRLRRRRVRAGSIPTA